MNQESQNNTEIGGISSEERLWEKTIEQQQCQQKEQEDEDDDDDDIEAISSDDKAPISYCQQIKESPQHQRVVDETIVVALPHKTANTASNHIIRTMRIMRIIKMTRTRMRGLQDDESGAT